MFPELYQWFRRLFQLNCYETIFEDRIYPILLLLSAMFKMVSQFFAILAITFAVNKYCAPFVHIKHIRQDYINGFVFFGTIYLVCNLLEIPAIKETVKNKTLTNL